MSATVNAMDSASHLEERVTPQLSYYEKAADQAKKAYNRTETAIIVLGLLVPVVVNIPMKWGSDPNIFDVTLEMKVVATIMSLALAVLNGMANFKKCGDLWLSYRMTEELLKHEKFMFQTHTGKYEEPNTAFSEFVQTIESLLSAEHNKFRNLIEDSRRPAGKGPVSAGTKP